MTIKPARGESEADFAIRAHAALAKEFPSTRVRNSIVFAAWRQASKESPIEKFSRERFPPDEFRKVEDVPIFAEHETETAKYGRDELKAIAEKCNGRIADTGDYACLSDGHTPDREQETRGMRQPDVLGYAGPFRLGMIGEKNPRWAIFADEWHMKSEADRLRRMPRRSPEVWLEPKISDRFFDPIAALGAQTPRLDMGMRFGKIGDREVAKYAACMTTDKYDAAFAGGDNTFVPSEQPKKEKHSMAMQPEDVDMIITALMATKEMQWVAQQVKEAEGATMQGEEGQLGDDMGEPDADNMGGPPDGDADDDGLVNDGTPEEMPAPEAKKPPMPEEPEKKNMPYAKTQDGVDRYAKLESELEATRRKLEATEKRLAANDAVLAQEVSKRRKVERFSRLSSLEETHILDVEKELKRAENMTDEDFNSHVEVIRENYARTPVGVELYVPGEGRNVHGKKLDTNTPEFSQKVRARADKYQRERSRNPSLPEKSYNEFREEEIAAAS